MMALPQQVSPSSVATAVVVTMIVLTSEIVVVIGYRLTLSDRH